MCWGLWFCIYLWHLSLLTDAAVFKANTKTTTPQAWLLLLHGHRGRMSHNNIRVGWLEGGWSNSDWWWMGIKRYFRWLVSRERRGAWFLWQVIHRWFLRFRFVWMHDRALNLKEKVSQHSQQSQIVSAKQFTHVISVLHNLIEARWWRNETIDMHVVKIAKGLEKPK